MRVALLVTDLQPGGTPLRLARLARGLRSAGVTPLVGCLAPAGPVSAELAADGIETFACDARGAHDLGALVRLAAHVRRLAPDLIHSTLTHANVAARLVGGGLGIPVLSSTATIEVERPWHIRLERATGGWDAGHLVCSAALADHVIHCFGLRPERVHVVPPLIQPPREMERDAARRALDVPDETFVVAWAGRFDPVKRVSLLIDAAHRLGDGNFALVLSGDGPLRDALHRQASTGAARERIRFVGWRSDLSPLLAAADVLALPSLTEGVPNVALEAMWVGRPVVGDDIPALRELDAKPPRLLRLPRLDAESLAAALRTLRDNAPLRESLGRRAHHWARSTLDPAEAVAAVIDVYEHILA